MGPDSPEVPSKRARRPRSLRARALSLLARREHSRLELRRKLAPHAESPEQLDTVLDTLESQGLLSNERFADSVVNRRAARFGTARIRQELREHGLPAELVGEHLAELDRTEYERAHEVWARRFGTPPADLPERMRQARFLAARGFRADVVRRVLGRRPADDEPSLDPDADIDS
ncbi:MAG: recombination regulator RecX [Burkholderiaceae bacterium]|nr:recombination regulator RecX [Burkholderiaceae bacterium]